MDGLVGWSKTLGVVLLVWCILFVQYKRIHELENKILGFSKSSLNRKIYHSVIMGIFGGIIGTIAMIVLDIKVDVGDFTYLLPVAVLLMLINVRYLCFSYGGGLIALCSLIFGAPKINIPSLMMLVGILHFIESVLIWLDGHQNATPIFIEDERHGIIGGFILQRFWPIPFVIILTVLGILGGGEINNGNMGNIPLKISVVVAALGYGDIALSHTPRKKSQISALRLLLFSIVLIVFSRLAMEYDVFQWIASIFAPLGHETLIVYGQREEKRRVPLFRRHSRGVTVLDIKKDSHGEKMGLHSGDVILSMNNGLVNDREDIQKILSTLPNLIRMEVEDALGKIKIVEYRNYPASVKSLGVIVIPQTSSVVFDPQTSIHPIKKFIAKIRH